MTCGYRSPVANPSNPAPLLSYPPDHWICGCPAGSHALGLNCVNDQAKCRIAKRYAKEGLPSYRYNKSGAKAAKAQTEAVEAAAESLPPELANIVRTKYRLPQGKRGVT